MQQRRALGRGLDSLIPTGTPVAVAQRNAPGAHAQPLEVATDLISPNRQQPRQVFDEEKIRELAASIREQGIIQPLIVTELSHGRYELVAGERRLRASRLLGLPTVPVIVKKSLDEEGLLALALIENVQREDLNPIEEASAFHELVGQYNYTQEDVANKVGKSRVYVANSLRLLKLPQTIKDDLAAGRYSAGHARALLGLSNIHEQMKIRDHIITQTPTVRDVEQMVQAREGVVRRVKRGPEKKLSPQLAMIREEMTQALGTKVRIKQRSTGAGQLVIEYYSLQDLDRIYRKIVS